MARILVIDDDELLRKVIVKTLVKAGYEAVGAGDGECGLELFAGAAFDLVITDIVMPQKEGVETILALREKSKTLPIIAISGGGSRGAENYLRAALKLGADRVLAKPFDIKVFLDVVGECLSGAGRGQPETPVLKSKA